MLPLLAENLYYLSHRWRFWIEILWLLLFMYWRHILKKNWKNHFVCGVSEVLCRTGVFFSQIIYFWGNIIKISNTFQSKWRIYHTVTLLVIISVIMEKIIFSLISLLVQKTRDLSGKTTVLKIMITSSWWSRNEGRYLYIF